MPRPGPDEVLINIKYSGVCHTDLHAANGDWPLESKIPRVGGHERAGIVVALGSLIQDIQLDDHAGVKVGCICLRLDREGRRERESSLFLIVGQRLMPPVLFLPAIRRASMPKGSTLWLYSRWYISAVLHC